MGFNSAFTGSISSKRDLGTFIFSGLSFIRFKMDDSFSTGDMASKKGKKLLAKVTCRDRANTSSCILLDHFDT